MKQAHPLILVGGGVSGLLVGSTLQAQGKHFLGLERSERLGGRLLLGHHRAYHASTAQFFTERLGVGEWSRIDEAARERRKGEWGEASTELSEEERFLTGSPFYSPACSLQDLAQQISEGISEKFILNRAATSINLQTRTLTCQDGSEYVFDTLVWCASLDSLLKACPGIHIPKNRREVAGGLSLELVLNTPLFDCRNTVVFQFRHKDLKLCALGIHEGLADDRYRLNWSVFLDEELADDREETAKCVRSLKRELNKEFPALKEKIRAERIVYVPGFAGFPAAPLKSLQLLPNIFYAGADARTHDADETVWDLDLAVENSRKLTELIA